MLAQVVIFSNICQTRFYSLFLPYKKPIEMSLKDKYQSALDFAKEVGAEMENFHEEDGHIVFNGTVATPYLRNAIWDKLKTINGLKKDDAAPTEVKANIKVSDDSVYHKHTVVAGETLGKIAKHYFDDASKYVAIFEANTDILKDPNMIVVGQVLSIPNP